MLFSEDIQDPIYQFTYRLVWSNDTERIQEFIRRNTNNPNIVINISVGGGRVEPALERNTNVKHAIIALCLKWDNSLKQNRLLMHEVGHAVFTMMKLRSIQLPQNGDWNNNDEECFLYYQQWLTEQCQEILNRPNKPWHLAEETPLN